MCRPILMRKATRYSLRRDFMSCSTLGVVEWIIGICSYSASLRVSLSGAVLWKTIMRGFRLQTRMIIIGKIQFSTLVNISALSLEAPKSWVYSEPESASMARLLSITV